jgi:hypothetical protein
MKAIEFKGNSGLCSESENSKPEFRAISPEGDTVKVVVCHEMKMIKGEVISQKDSF